METHQCPECNLRFRSESEMKDHLAKDHPDFHIEPKSIEDSMMRRSHRRPHYDSQ